MHQAHETVSGLPRERGTPRRKQRASGHTAEACLGICGQDCPEQLLSGELDKETYTQHHGPQSHAEDFGATENPDLRGGSPKV